MAKYIELEAEVIENLELSDKGSSEDVGKEEKE